MKSAAFEGGFEFGACIATIGKDVTQERKSETDGFEDIDSAVAVLNVSGMDQDKDQKSTGVSDDMAFASFDLLASVIAANAAALRGFDL